MYSADLTDEKYERKKKFLQEILTIARNGREPGVEDVHTTHCCAIHGCKYGDSCPVTTREHVQCYACERCDDQATEMVLAEENADAYAESVVILDGRDGPSPRVYIVCDGDRLPLFPRDAVVEAKAQYVDAVWAVKSAYLAGVLGLPAEIRTGERKLPEDRTK